MNQKKDTFDYNIFVRFIKFLWSGVMYARKSKPVLITYIVLIIITIVYNFMYGGCTEILCIDFFVVLGVAINEYRKDAPDRKKRKFFFGVFREMKFFSNDGSAPVYLYEDYFSRYVTKIAFYTMIPLSEWYPKKESLEMYLNVKIIDIEQKSDDNRTIYVVVQEKPLPDMIEWNDNYIDYPSNILNLGVGYNGVVGIDLEKYPHTFIAGETGSGKSNILKCLIHQSLVKEYDTILIDFKRGVSFSCFSNDIDIYYDYVPTMEILIKMVKETKRRLDLFRDNSVDNLNDYNKISRDYLHRTVIFIDELAELLKMKDKEISSILYDSIETLTRLSRATGIHLIMGIQRPDSTIVNGQIKNNVSFRVCGRFVDKEPSRIMLGTDNASKLVNVKGRFIVKDDDLQEVQSFYFKDVSRALYRANKEEANKTPIHSGNEVKRGVKEQITEEPKTTKKPDTSEKLNFDFSDIENN